MGRGHLKLADTAVGLGTLSLMTGDNGYLGEGRRSMASIKLTTPKLREVKQRFQWGVFDSELDRENTHVMPCDLHGYVAPPHKFVNCPCQPDIKMGPGLVIHRIIQ